MLSRVKKICVLMSFILLGLYTGCSCSDFSLYQCVKDADCKQKHTCQSGVCHSANNSTVPIPEKLDCRFQRSLIHSAADKIMGIVVSHSLPVFVSLDRSRTLILWDKKTRRALDLKRFSPSLSVGEGALSMHPDGKSIALVLLKGAASNTSFFKIVPTKEKSYRFEGPGFYLGMDSTSPTSVRFHPSGKWLAIKHNTSKFEDHIRLYSMDNYSPGRHFHGKLLAELSSPFKHKVSHYAFDQKGRWLATTYFGTKIDIWNVKLDTSDNQSKKELKKKLTITMPHFVYQVLFHPSEDWLIAIHEKGIQVYSIATGKSIATLSRLGQNGASTYKERMLFLKDGTLVIAEEYGIPDGGPKTLFSFWKLLSQGTGLSSKRIARWEYPRNDNLGVQLSLASNGETILIQSITGVDTLEVTSNGFVHKSLLSNGRREGQLGIRMTRVIQFHPTKPWVLTMPVEKLKDEKIQLRSLETGKILTEWEVESRQLLSLFSRFSRDGRYLFWMYREVQFSGGGASYGSDDKFVFKVWELNNSTDNTIKPVLRHQQILPLSHIANFLGYGFFGVHILPIKKTGWRILMLREGEPSSQGSPQSHTLLWFWTLTRKKGAPWDTTTLQKIIIQHPISVQGSLKLRANSLKMSGIRPTGTSYRLWMALHSPFEQQVEYHFWELKGLETSRLSLKRGNHIKAFKSDDLSAFSKLSFSEDDKTILSTESNRLHFWERLDGAYKHESRSTKNVLVSSEFLRYNTVFHPSGGFVATSSQDDLYNARVQLWNVKSRKAVGVIVGEMASSIPHWNLKLHFVKRSTGGSALHFVSGSTIQTWYCK